MNKLVFKPFYSMRCFGYSRFGVMLFLLAITIFSSGCRQITGKAMHQIPNEVDREPREMAKSPEIYFCPRDGCSKIFESYIKSANSSVYCAFYSLNLKNVISALAKKSRTTDVRLVMESSNYKEQVKGSIRLDDDKQLMHNKFCVIDSSIVITGSFNPTDNDDNYNNNNIIVIHSGNLAKNYMEEFGELWSGKFGEGKKSKYKAFYINNARVENYFCPEDCNPEASSALDKDEALYKIVDLIRNAKESVKVASFTFTNERGADELLRAEARGVNVTIVIESKQRNVIGSQYQRLKDFGLNILLDGNKYNMHHKFMVIDGKIVVTGSPNFTKSGFGRNDENILIIYDKKIANKFLKEFDNLW